MTALFGVERTKEEAERSLSYIEFYLLLDKPLSISDVSHLINRAFSVTDWYFAVNET